MFGFSRKFIFFAVLPNRYLKKLIYNDIAVSKKIDTLCIAMILCSFIFLKILEMYKIQTYPHFA